jgi:Flp pilus assembly protein TadD
VNSAEKLEAIIGYYNLELFEEALQEMGSLPRDVRTRPELRAMETAILIRQKHWSRALELSRRLCVELPDQPSPWLDTSYCLHELGRTREARDHLIGGPDCLKIHPVYYYNMACYEAQIGNLEQARAYLDQACEMDEEFTRIAADDPDLQPIA